MTATDPRAPIRTGVIGAGFIGPAHIESLRRLGFVQVVALADNTQELAERRAADLSVPQAYGRYQDLIADPAVQVVDICAPNILHYPLAKAALAAGKHVISEKPLGMSSAESAELLQMAKASGVVHAVVFNIRFYPLVRQMKAMIERGDIGTVYDVHGGYSQDWLLLDTDYNWRVEAANGGALRAVGDIGSHWLDMAQFVTGLSVRRVLADLATFVPVRQKPSRPIDTYASEEVERTPVQVDTEDAATVMMHLTGGAHGLMHVSQVSAGRKNRIFIEVNGSRGSLAWDGERPNELWIGHRERPNELLIKDPALMAPEAAGVARYPGGHAEGFADTHTALQRSVYDFIRASGYASGRQPDFPTFAAGHRENVIGDGILQSHRQERWIEVPPAV
jgi:predicted dehydrogenase